MEPQTLIEFLIIGLCLFYFRYWMGREFKSIKTQLENKVSEKNCDERQKGMCRKIKIVEDATKEQWTVLNRHGHRELSGSGNDVVRL